MKILVLVLAVMFLVAPVVMAVETTKADYSSPNGHLDGFADFLNEQTYLTHQHEVYIDEPRNPMEAYLGVEYHPNNKNWTLGGRVLCDVNNLDRDALDENLRAEVGATYHFGPGLE